MICEGEYDEMEHEYWSKYCGECDDSPCKDPYKHSTIPNEKDKDDFIEMVAGLKKGEPVPVERLDWLVTRAKWLARHDLGPDWDKRQNPDSYQCIDPKCPDAAEMPYHDHPESPPPGNEPPGCVLHGAAGCPECEG